MNWKFVTEQLGLLLIVLAVCMGAVAVLDAVVWVQSWRDVEMTTLPLAATAGVGVLVGGGCWWVGRRRDSDVLTRREALLLVAASWVVGAALSALPYFLWAWTRSLEGVDQGHIFRSYTACYFESMSGLTTTGATVLFPIQELPKSLLLWRALTHWLGGLGIVVLFVAVLPTVGSGGKKLFAYESSLQHQGGVRPRIAETARVLWLIYVGMTVVFTLALWAAGMTLFEAVTHTFSMLSTGGLSTEDASVGAVHFDTIAIDVLITIGMLLAGVNFVLYYQLTRGRWRAVYKDPELRVYIALKVVGTLVIAANLVGTDIITTGGERLSDVGVGAAAQYASFQAVSLQTGTGFGTADFDRWPFLSLAVILGLILVGGCAGSTAGGIKVIRFWVTLRVMAASLERAFRPRVVRPLKVGGAAIDDEAKIESLVYVLALIVLTGIGGFLVMWLEQGAEQMTYPFTTAMTASLASVCNVGPGLAGVGPTANYGWLSGPSMWVLSLLMLLGRLEVYAVFVLFLPRFWRGD